MAPTPTTAPGTELMSTNGLDLMPGETEVYAADIEALGGGDVKLVVTDRRLITRSSASVCAFPLNLICICFKADVDESYSIADIKYIRPWTFKGTIASCLEALYPLSKAPCCCCVPGMRSGGMTVGVAKAAGDYVPGWSFWPLFSTGGGWSYSSLSFQMKGEEATALRKALTMATGLGLAKQK